MDSHLIALRDALRNDLPRLVARQEELTKALDSYAQALKDDPMGVGFKLASSFPELRGLMPMLSLVSLLPVDELYKIAQQCKVSEGIVQISANIAGRLLDENPLLLSAFYRIFPLRSEGRKPLEKIEAETTDSKTSATNNLRNILAGGLWSHAGEANNEGSYPVAVKALEQAIEFAHESGDWLLEAWALWKIALIHPQFGTPKGFAEFQKTQSEYLERAQGYYLRALNILDTNPAAQDSKDADNLKSRLLLLLCATNLADNPLQTLQYAKRAHQVGMQLQNKSDVFEALVIAGNALIMLNEPTRALLPLFGARALAIELKDNQKITRILMPLANAWGLLNHIPLASAAMIGALLFEDEEVIGNLPSTESAAFEEYRAAANRIRQAGEAEKFMLDLEKAISSIADKFSFEFLDTPEGVAGGSRTSNSSLSTQKKLENNK